MHMLHVTIGVYLSGNRRAAEVVHSYPAWPVARGLAGNARLQPVSLRRRMYCWSALLCVAIIVWLKPKLYDASDVEVAGLYWHFVDLVWMFIFPLVYLMSTKII